MLEPQIFLDHNSTGMAESQVNFNNIVLLETSILIPPMIEQLTIAAILDSIDNTINHIETVIEKMYRIKAGLLHDLLTCGLNDNAELRDPVRHPELFKDTLLGKIPKNWFVGPLGEQFTLQRGYDITTAEQRPGNIPVVSSSGITSYHDTPMVHESGVVTGRKGKLGDTYYIDTPFWPHDTSLWVKNFHGNNKQFAAILLKYLRLERLDAATSVPTLNRNVVHPLIIAIPRLDEQLRIITRLECMSASIKEEESARIKLVSMKQGLMRDLLTGKVPVPEERPII